MVVQRKQLLNALKMVMPGTGQPVLEGADSFIFYKNRIFTYNDFVSVSVPIASSGLDIDNLDGALQSDEFFNLISKFSGDEVDFTAGDGVWTFKCGKAKAELALMEFDYAGRLEGISPSSDFIPVPDDFLQGLGVCLMKGNKTRLAGVYIKGDVIVSTDGWQINKFTMKNADLPVIFLNDEIVQNILKINGIKEMQLQGNWLHFKTDTDAIFSVKVMNADAFPFDKVVGVIDRGKPTGDENHATFPEELFASVDRAVSFSSEMDDRKAVSLLINNERIKVSAEKQSGKYEEEIPWQVDSFNDEVSIQVDANAMKCMQGNSLEFYIVPGPEINGKSTPRIYFVTPQSAHLMATIATKDE